MKGERTINRFIFKETLQLLDSLNRIELDLLLLFFLKSNRISDFWLIILIIDIYTYVWYLILFFNDQFYLFSLFNDQFYSFFV